MLRLQTGDIILTSKNSIIAKFMGAFQSDQVQWGHVMVAKDMYTLYEPVSPLSTTTLEKFKKKRKHYKVIRYKHITPDDKLKIQNLLNKLVGVKYSYKRIILQLLDHVFQTNWFSDRFHDSRSQVCSSMAAWAYYASMRIQFNGVSWRSCDPDDIEDHIEKNPEDWIIIGEK